MTKINTKKIKIGKNCTLGENIIYLGNVAIGNNCKIGNNVILGFCSIGHDTVIEDNSIIGYDTITGHYEDRSNFHNKKLELSNIEPKIKIGNNVLIRTNVTIYVDTVIHDNCWINHNAIIRENVIILEDSSIGSNTICENNVSIGKRCLIQNNTEIGSESIIESFVFIGPGVTFTNNSPIGHLRDVKSIIRAPKLRLGCAIGGGVTICPGVEIGEESIVAAGSVVTESVPPRIIISGNPAQKTKNVSKKGLIKKEIREKYGF
jgi:UDP-2-acetamido-3-amino-2,3-dideoxy-glucuronate N-acetyltransferase